MKNTTIKDAIIKVLKKIGKPLYAKEIYEKIIEWDYYRFNAENPLHIVNTELRRHSEGINFPTAHKKKYFQFLTNGKYWIAKEPVPQVDDISLKSENYIIKDSENLKQIVEDLKQIHTKHTDAFKKQILTQLKQIPPKTFETFAKLFLEVYGFIDMQVTNYVKDGGFDGFGKLKVGITYFNVAFQCKRWTTNSVSRTEIDKFRGAIQGSYEQGIIITTSNFSKEALNATRRNGAVPIILIDGNTLIDFMIEKKFGVDLDSIPVYVNALDKVLNEE